MILLLRYWKLIGFAAFVVLALTWHFSAVHSARLEERAECKARIERSIAAAREADAESNRRAIQKALQDRDAERSRASQAEEERTDAESEVAALDAALRKCRKPTDTDWRRLQ